MLIGRLFMVVVKFVLWLRLKLCRKYWFVLLLLECCVMMRLGMNFSILLGCSVGWFFSSLVWMMFCDVVLELLIELL